MPDPGNGLDNLTMDKIPTRVAARSKVGHVLPLVRVERTKKILKVAAMTAMIMYYENKRDE